HPDKDQIISKMICDISNKEIYDWLSVLYSDNKYLIISKKNLDIFKKDYLDIYNIVREDIIKVQFSNSIQDNLKEEIQGNEEYKKKLLEIVDKELDIKTIIK